MTSDQRGDAGVRHYTWIGDNHPPGWEIVGSIDVADPADITRALDRGLRIGSTYDGGSGLYSEPCQADLYRRKPTQALRGDEVVKMLQAAERERDEAREAVDADEQVIAERDSYHEWADKLAHAVGGLEVGEHSNINNPWQNAIEMAETLHARAEAAEAALSAAQEEVARMRAVMRETSEYLRKLEGNMLANDADMMLDDCLPPSFHADQIDQALTKETPDAG